MSTQAHRFYLLGLVGHPVQHSLSPVMFKAAFHHLGLNGDYQLIDLPPHDLSAGLTRLVAKGFVGFNVTIPHKRHVVALCDELTPEAKQAYAVNAVVVKAGGHLRGHNTDVAGFKKALSYNMPSSGKLETCCVIGAGGAAYAAVTALIQLGCSRIMVAARKAALALHLVEEMKTSLWAQDIKLPQFEVLLPEFKHLPATPDLVVNCTPIGLNYQTPALMPGWIEEFGGGLNPCQTSSEKTPPLREGSPEDVPQWILDIVKMMSTDGFFFDMVYSQDGMLPKLAWEAQRQGRRVCDGTDMLVYQATTAFQFMSGEVIPGEVMRQAVLAERARRLVCDKKGSSKTQGNV